MSRPVRPSVAKAEAEDALARIVGDKKKRRLSMWVSAETLQAIAIAAATAGQDQKQFTLEALRLRGVKISE